MFDKRKWIVILILFGLLLFALPINLASASLNQRANNQSAFDKLGPINGSTSLPSTLIFWTVSGGATRYEYCYDTINNSSCDTVWISTPSPSALLTGLSTATYYWQVRAIGPNGTLYGNGGIWWSFHIGFVPTPTRTATATATITRTPTITLTPTPIAFKKLQPTQNSVITTINTTFSWSANSTVIEYQYCYDTVSNFVCDTTWISAGQNTSAISGPLSNNTTYYWQARAKSSAGVFSPAIDGWRTFTVQLPVP